MFRLAPLAEARLGHDSALVRGMAVWALARLLLPREELSGSPKRRGAKNEMTQTFALEWDAALEGRT